MSGLVAWEKLGKFGTGRDYSVPLGKFLNGLEMSLMNFGNFGNFGN